MSEISQYESYKKKLQGVCDENDLFFRFVRTEYPITLTISPASADMTQIAMPGVQDEDEASSPDAAIVFSIKDGILSYKTSQTFTISDALLSKIKNLFKKLHYFWLQYFFRELIEKGVLTTSTMPVIDEDDAEDFNPDSEEDDEEEDFDEYLEVEDSNTLDADLDEAVRIVRQENKATADLLVRRMSISRGMASYLLRRMENTGIIGPEDDAGHHEVLPVDVPEDEE